jgi:hypothetical protein
MPSDHELLLKRSRELLLTAKITVSESGRAIRRAQQVLTAMKLSKVRPAPSDECSRAPRPGPLASPAHACVDFQTKLFR